jgi:hypothetical protein
MRLLSFIPALAASLIAGTFAAHPARAQNRVANYGLGEPGTAAYEHFSFWTHAGRRSDIHYAYGKDRNDLVLRYAGRARLAGQPGFRVRFPDGSLRYLALRGDSLLVSPTPTAAPKTFAWEYEGPINGVGTACSVCVADATAAATLLRRHYLR